jgi:hypothetical protein
MRLLFCAPLLAVISGAALAKPLTFDAALSQAREDAPSIRAKTLGVDAARSARGAAGALPDPTLAAGIDSFPISGPLAFKPGRDNFTMARVSVSQDIPILPSAMLSRRAPTAISTPPRPIPRLRPAPSKLAWRLRGSIWLMPSAGSLC